MMEVGFSCRLFLSQKMSPDASWMLSVTNSIYRLLDPALTCIDFTTAGDSSGLHHGDYVKMSGRKPMA